MIWAGTCKYHYRDLKTLAEVTELMDEIDDFQALFTIVIEAYQAGQPGPKDNEDPDSDAPASPKAGAKGGK